MHAQPPSPATFRKAVEIYLRHAHAHGLPSAVRAKAETLRALPPEDLFESPIFERDPSDPRRRYAVRLGNEFYPHMKLAVERRPDGKGYLFRADTHDRHCCPPPGSREYNSFVGLMKRNEKIAAEIEAAWTEAGLETFKSYLREDLARRGKT